MAPKNIMCGWECPEVDDVPTFIETLEANGLQFASINVCREQRQKDIMQCIAHKAPVPPLARSDVQLMAGDYDTMTVARVSSWLKLDSSNDDVRKACEVVLQQELDYAEHLGLPAILLPSAPMHSINYSRFMNSHLNKYTTSQYWLRVPVTHDEEGESTDPWASWNQFRTLCDHTLKLFVALEITSDLPDEEVMVRWLGEPVKALILNCDLFLTNAKGYPVLSKAHQAAIKAFMKLNVQILLTGTLGHEHSYKAYQSYLTFLHSKRNEGKEDPLGEFASGYEDYLQSPLQPLADNLESQTYEVFEKDPVKYREYQRAVYEALLDRVPEDQKDTVVVRIMVVGAGRGPLVKASLMAAEKARRKVKVWAVEKNPNAIIFLQERLAREWGDAVTLVQTDMRDFKPDEKADILVSELLGSFGDNELSPECLDGVQHVLKDDGISIPCASTSYVAPLSSSKLYNEMRGMKEKNSAAQPHEMPYVVHIHNAARIAEPLPMFTFVHPNKDVPIDNRRYGFVKFVANKAATLHGVAGYFDTTLYKDIKLSIEPNTYSDGMFSWFPIFFPLETPMSVREGDHVVIHFWRNVDKHKVWYEWCISSPYASLVHNPNARSYSIGL